MAAELEQAGASDAIRGECSLCVLTNQFLQLLLSSGPCGVDLKHAASHLQVRKTLPCVCAALPGSAPELAALFGLVQLGRPAIPLSQSACVTHRTCHTLPNSLSFRMSARPMCMCSKRVLLCSGTRLPGTRVDLNMYTRPERLHQHVLVRQVKNDTIG
jgi:hypothetical protein